jgi:hypothetical protein
LCSFVVKISEFVNPEQVRYGTFLVKELLLYLLESEEEIILLS